jgi:hypothetical protein
MSMEDWPHAIHLASPQQADTASSGGQECHRCGRLQARILAVKEFLAAVTGNPENAESAAEVVSSWLRSG